jgi:thiol-disulfide isomerase/thioredoxin
VAAGRGNYRSGLLSKGSVLRLVTAFALLALAACDAEQAPAPDGGAKPSAWAGPEAERQEGTGRLDRSRAGSEAPRVLFQDPAGEPASLADFRGKPVLLNLWATWCAPCVAEMPTLDALAARDGGIEVLTVSQDLNGEEKVDAFFAKRKFEMLEPYIDPELTLMGELGVTTLPTTILYDAQGREVWRMTGMEEWTGPRAAALIAEATKVSREAAR